MKRKCNDCRAYDNINHDCELHYKTQSIYYYNVVIGCKPAEECPKPKTYEEYFKASKKSI